MKSQQELYQALEKVDGIIRDNRLFETLEDGQCHFHHAGGIKEIQ